MDSAKTLQSLRPHQPNLHPAKRWAGAAALAALAALSLAGNAQARDVFWSVGVNSPGVSVGVSNNRPVYVAPAPIYVQPAPVYVQPAPLYVQPSPVFVQPGSLFIEPGVVYGQGAAVYQPGWAPPGRAHGWHNKHGHHDEGRDYDRDHDHDGARRDLGRGERNGFYAQNQMPAPYGYGQVAPVYPRGGYYGR